MNDHGYNAELINFQQMCEKIIENLSLSIIFYSKLPPQIQKQQDFLTGEPKDPMVCFINYLSEFIKNGTKINLDPNQALLLGSLLERLK